MLERAAKSAGKSLFAERKKREKWWHDNKLKYSGVNWKTSL